MSARFLPLARFYATLIVFAPSKALLLKREIILLVRSFGRDFAKAVGFYVITYTNDQRYVHNNRN